MPGCARRCVSITATTYSGVWWQAREHYGPNPQSLSDTYRLELYNEDLVAYGDWLTDWNTTYGGIVDTPKQFGKWLNWRFSIGTATRDNLPQRKRDHVGISCVKCPYDSNAEDARSQLMLGFMPTTRTDHGSYYMRVSSRGGVWGFECTSDSCPYYLANGVRYFHV